MLRLEPLVLDESSRQLYEHFVPEHHPLRQIDKVIDFSFILPLVAHRYNHWIGRPAEHPERMVDAGGNAYYYLRDGLGSVTGIVDSSGTLTATYSYDAYGNLRSSTGTIANAFRYTGEWYDSETRLYYLRARYYDPAVGRFVTKDPWLGTLNRPYSQNPYLYVENNATNLADPTGLFSWGLGGALALAVPGIGVTLSEMIVVDDRGNIGFLVSVGGGGYSGGIRAVGRSGYSVPTASVGLVAQLTTAHDIFALASPTEYGGGSIGDGLGGGLDALVGTNSDCTDYFGVQGQIQLAARGPLPAELHGGSQVGVFLVSINPAEWLARALFGR